MNNTQAGALADRVVDAIFKQLDRDCEWLVGRDHAVRLVQLMLQDPKNKRVPEVAPDPPERAVCPEHCEDHNYMYNSMLPYKVYEHRGDPIPQVHAEDFKGVAPRVQETKPRIYAASRASLPERPAMWKELRAQGFNIISSWIDEAEPGATTGLGELWERIAQEIASADGLVLYVEADDFPLKGALIEVGIALGLGKPIHVVMPDLEPSAPSYRPIGSWIMHPSVVRFKNVRQACKAQFEAARAPEGQKGKE
jgi:hypothetical protein